VIGPGGVCSWHLPCSQGTVGRALAYSLQLSFLPLTLSPFPFLLLIRSAGGDALLGAICCGVCPGWVASRRGADRGWEDSTEAACWLQPLAVRVGNHQTSRRAVCGKTCSRTIRRFCQENSPQFNFGSRSGQYQFQFQFQFQFQSLAVQFQSQFQFHFASLARIFCTERPPGISNR